MIYIYRRKPSLSAMALAACLGGRKIRRTNRHFGSNDRVICWGEEGARGWMNNPPVLTKYGEVLTLIAAGVPTIQVDHVPGSEGEWLGRSNHHLSGRDLLGWTKRVDFYVKREQIAKEYRVHSFDGRTIRGGLKIPHPGHPSPHPWIRSGAGGWRVSYGGQLRQRHRDLAHRAVRALGLTFGAVDIGERVDKTLFVLEVNRAPGIDGGTIEAYARGITRYLEEHHEVA